LQKEGFKITKVNTELGVVNVKKRQYEVRVTLINPDESMQIITLDEAGKIARRRNLKLLRVLERDPKTDRAVYKLLSSKYFLQYSFYFANWA